MNDENISNKKLTLSGFNLGKAQSSSKLRPDTSDHSSSFRYVTTVEIRKKRKSNSSNLISEGGEGSLTKQEQISRINALHNAALIKHKEEVENHFQEETKSNENEQVEDCNDKIHDTVVEETKYLDNNSKNVEEGGNDDNQKLKKAKVNKDHFSNAYSKHSKLALEKILTNDEGMQKSGFSFRAKKNKRLKVVKRSNISREVIIPDQITVKALAMRMAEQGKDVLNALSQISKNVQLDDIIDSDTACKIAVSFNHTFKRVSDDQIEKNLFQINENNLSKLPRPPIVTFMGHVDHGKTSLLDLFRKSNVAEKEFGGITQGIGAYQTTTESGHKITFIDTPGHEAFTAMRTCGANITDIAVIVIAADDGIMEQTIEAMSHAKAANVAIIVAINKVDKVNNAESSMQKIINNLPQYDLIPEELGGEVIVVPVSAKQKINLDKLEEAILLISELMDLRSVTDCHASGVVVESRIDKNRGILATLIVQQGTLKIGDIVVVGNTYGKIRNMLNHNKTNEKNALPSMPVEVAGLNGIPNSGDKFVVVNSEKQAREVIEYRISLKQNYNENTNPLDIFNQENDTQETSIILKCDVMGSIEAISNSIDKLNNEEVKLNILHKAVGGLTDSDILLAEASKAIILAFNVRIDSKVKDLAKQKKVDIRIYNIIYELIDDVRSHLSKMLKPLIQEVHVGFASVKKVFNVGKAENIIGCYVTSGIMKRGVMVKLMRSGKLIYEGKIKTLRRFKDNVKEVNNGFECGISLDNYFNVQPDDIIEAFDLVTEERKLG